MIDAYYPPFASLVWNDKGEGPLSRVLASVGCAISRIHFLFLRLCAGTWCIGSSKKVGRGPGGEGKNGALFEGAFQLKWGRN